MMHSYNELYQINGKGYYTEAYVIANNIPVTRTRKEGTASKCVYLGTDKGTKKVHDVDGVKIIYTYGEKTWFDEEGERDAHRLAMARAREEQTKRNKLLKAIMTRYEAMTTEELEQMMTTM